MMARVIRILLADDQHLVRGALAALLSPKERFGARPPPRRPDASGGPWRRRLGYRRSGGFGFGYGSGPGPAPPRPDEGF